MKTNLKNIALLLILIAANTAKAQQKAPATAQKAPAGDTVMVSKLAKDLGIDRRKAVQVYAALHYQPTAQLAAITGNPNIPVAEKTMMVKKVMMARHRRIDSLLTPAQKALLMQHMAPTAQKEAAAMAEARQRHAQEVAQVPQQVTREATYVRAAPQFIQVMPTKIDTVRRKGTKP